MIHSRTSLSRGGWLLATIACLSLWLTGPHTMAAIDAITGTDFPRALLGVASLFQLATSLWVMLVVGVTVLIGPSAALRLITPRVLRSALFAGTVGALAIGPAHADQGAAPSRDHAAVRSTTRTLAGLPFPDRPASNQRAIARSASAPHPLPSHRHPLDRSPPNPGASSTVTVQPGDTLWAIARRSLADGASDAEIARSCHRWFDANRSVIGDDPNLIVSAQHLHPPTKDHS